MSKYLHPTPMMKLTVTPIRNFTSRHSSGFKEAGEKCSARHSFPFLLLVVRIGSDRSPLGGELSAETSILSF
jgi:hypothetical protein